MERKQKQAGFTAVELLITLFVAAAFLIASYQLFNLIIKDSGSTRSESRAANVAYDYLRQYAASSTTIPCTPSSPLTNAPLSVDGLTDVTIGVTVSCLPNAISSLSKVEVTVSYNNPVQTIKYSTYTSSTGSNTITDITDGLVAWWKLNGDTNNSVGSPNGVASNAIPTTHDGVPNTAYAFNGTSSSVITGSSFNLGTSNVTISAWIYTSTATNSGAFVKVGGSGYGIGMGNANFDNTSPGSNLILLYEGIRWINTGAIIGTGWHHVVMVINGSGVPTAYIDGSSVGTSAGAGPSAPGSAATYIGGGNGSSRYFKGSVDDVRLYNRALSTIDIQTLYSNGAQ